MSKNHPQVRHEVARHTVVGVVEQNSHDCSSPETKHSSAFTRSAVSRNESKGMLSIFSINARQNSVLVAYTRDRSVGIGLLRRTVLVLCTLRHPGSVNPT
jgi:hypothetical protein